MAAAAVPLLPFALTEGTAALIHVVGRLFGVVVGCVAACRW